MIRIKTILFTVAAAASLLSAGLVWYLATQLPVQQTVSPASIGGPFLLTDQNGVLRSDRDFRGRFVLLYFGYTWCPDVCPTTLQHISDALTKLGAKSARIVPVFVTVDPERDSPAVLKKYVSAFGPQFVGLTGNAAAIARVAHAYRVYFAKQPGQGGSYSVTHSSTIYLVGPAGKLVTFYDADLSADALARDLKSRL